MDEQAKQRLNAAGWSADRRSSVHDIEGRLKARGFELFPAARDFLERYGRLHFKGDSIHARSSSVYFHTDPEDVPTDPGWTRRWESVSGTRVYPIGQTAYGEYTLFMDEHGRVFGMDMYLVVTYWADNADELLDSILGNGLSFRPVYSEDCQPLRDHRMDRE